MKRARSPTFKGIRKVRELFSKLSRYWEGKSQGEGLLGRSDRQSVGSAKITESPLGEDVSDIGDLLFLCCRRGEQSGNIMGEEKGARK